MKKLIGIYKNHLRSCMDVEAQSQVISNPFIRLNIECILGSYDPNVTTTKDEVIFANEPKVLTLFEKMCKELYVSTGIDSGIPEKKGSMEHLQGRHESPDLLLRDDGEQVGENLRGLLLAGSQIADEALTCLSSLNSGNHPEGSPGRPRHNDHSDVISTVQEESHSIIIEDKPGKLQKSPAFDQQTSLPVTTKLSCEPESTQSLLRTVWEVYMARGGTASPEGNTQTVLLGPPQTDIVEYLKSQRIKQTQREEPNPWSLAKKATERYSTHHDDNPASQSQAIQRNNSVSDTDSHEPPHAPHIEGLQQEVCRNVAEQSTEDPRRPCQQFGRLRVTAAQRENSYEVDHIEPPILQRPAAIPGDFQALRHQDRRRITRDGEQFQSFGVRHSYDNLEIGPERGPGIRQRAYAQTPHPFPNCGQESVFDTPPPSSSPLHKPSRMLIRVGQSKKKQRVPVRDTEEAAPMLYPLANKLRQRNINFGVGIAQEPLRPDNIPDDCYPTMELKHGGNLNSITAMAETRRSRHRASPGPTEGEMKMALERLDALRPRVETTDCKKNEELSEERGRSLSRQPTTALSEISSQSYPRTRLTPVSRSKNKPHRRTRSELLPFEKPFSDSYRHMQSLTPELTEIREQTIKASDHDLYVLTGVQETAFSLQPAEMDDVSNKLQEIIEIWVYEEYGVELELEINIGTLLERDRE